MSELRTEITLAAPAERIWELLTDCALYAQWNPLFRNGAGRMQRGERLTLHVHLPHIEPFTITPTVLAATDRTGFRWRQIWLWHALFRWDYDVELEASSPERLIFRQRSRFSGLLAPLFTLGLGGAVRNGLEELNAAVRRWGEKGNVQCLRC